MTNVSVRNKPYYYVHISYNGYEFNNSDNFRNGGKLQSVYVLTPTQFNVKLTYEGDTPLNLAFQMMKGYYYGGALLE